MTCVPTSVLCFAKKEEECDMHDVWLALWASAKIGFKFKNLELAKMLKKSRPEEYLRA